MNEAYAIQDDSGMWLSQLPAIFGHSPYHSPILFPTARAAGRLRTAFERKTKIIVIEWQVKEEI